MPNVRKRILFFAEGATLAHVARPYVLAASLPPDAFDVVFARPSSFAWLTREASFQVLDLPCQASSVFARRLDRGLPLYDFGTLASYVDADLARIRDVAPDVVVGDFRLSLSVSARLARVPYATLCDAYWSPEAPLRPTLPVMPFTRYVPLGLAQRLFTYLSVPAFRLHAQPMERLRRRYGMAGLGHDLRLAYTDADLRLFANFPALFPEVRTHPGAAFAGPVAWSPSMPVPSDLPGDGLIYVTMGSSGSTDVLKPLFTVLRQLRRPVVVSTAGRTFPVGVRSDQIKIFDYLPGREVVSRARLVICNGGSPTTNQALAAGVPVLGIPTNMDQFLNMAAIERSGCGLSIRADRARPAELSAAIRTLLEDEAPRRQAARIAASFPAGDAPARFAELVTRLASDRSGAPASERRGAPAH